MKIKINKNQQKVTNVFAKLIINTLGLSSLLGTPDLWPYLAFFMFIPVIVHIGLFFLVESPKYLFICRNDKEKAKKGKKIDKESKS